jgi:hypothetical protein
MTNRSVQLKDETILRFVVKNQDGTAVDVGQATFIELTYRKPKGGLVTRVPVFETDGSDGVLVYQMVENELDTEGMWKFQIEVVLPVGRRYTSIAVIEVKPNLA